MRQLMGRLVIGLTLCIALGTLVITGGFYSLEYLNKTPLNEISRVLTLTVVVAGFGLTIVMLFMWWGFARVRKHVRKIVTDEKLDNQQPTTQQQPSNGLPEWILELPFRKLKKLDLNEPFDLVKLDEIEVQPGDDARNILIEKIRKTLKNADQTPEYDRAIERVADDIDFLKQDLLRLFRERDYEAKYYQTRYRRYQLGFMLLAASATVAGSLMAISLSSDHSSTLFFGLVETILALFTTYLATISGRESPLQRWLNNRHKAEFLRREYFRFLANLDPYGDKQSSIERQRLLALRAAKINLFGSDDVDEKTVLQSQEQILNEPQPTKPPAEETLQDVLPLNNGAQEQHVVENKGS